jgi:hypothetical protein
MPRFVSDVLGTCGAVAVNRFLLGLGLGVQLRVTFKRRSD